MCIIIYRPADNLLSMEMLEACEARNKDGWGIMMPTDTGIVRYKGMHLSEFKEVYESIPKDVEMAIHFRIRTDGLVNVANCHPFAVLNKEEDGEDLFLMHNGMIRTVKMHDKSMSDTWHWSEILLRPIVKQCPKLIHVPAFQWFMESSIGWSRVLLLDNEGNFVFLKEDDWKINKEEKDGCRYSIDPPSLKKPEPTGPKYGYGGTVGYPKNGANKYTDFSQPGVDGFGYRQGAGYGNNRQTFMKFDKDGMLVKSYGRDVPEGGGTNGSNRFPEKNVIALKGPGNAGVDDTTQSDSGTVIGVRESAPADEKPAISDASATESGETGLKKGGEAADAGLQRFSEEPATKTTLTKEEWLAVLVEEGLVEKVEPPSDIELEQAHEEDRYNFGIIPNSDKPIGLEFDNTRTHMLLNEKGAEDELLGVDPEDFEGYSFADIYAFVKEDPEEAALFLYRNYA